MEALQGFQNFEGLSEYFLNIMFLCCIAAVIFHCLYLYFMNKQDNVELKDFIVASLKKHKKLYLLDADEFISDLFLMNKDFTLEEAKAALPELVKAKESVEEKERSPPEAREKKLIASKISKRTSRATDDNFNQKEKDYKKKYNRIQVENKTQVNTDKNLKEKMRRKVHKDIREDLLVEMFRIHHSSFGMSYALVEICNLVPRVGDF